MLKRFGYNCASFQNKLFGFPRLDQPLYNVKRPIGYLRIQQGFKFRPKLHQKVKIILLFFVGSFFRGLFFVGSRKLYCFYLEVQMVFS